ncbi:hypothetical protein DICPUDRAFT_158595 [Dictyostelium purpureum]|uniref:EGF-like domain-containing protein n=1 Tax=Dictyostelium purpureum TaxID=5786 RepID=F1A201_DICPU|nr:uncharacterized protein DICPUDRAFT_158595 [Dictyostelium purpureum]EGC29788.1 hypothetical protein DICPUDRAFT_158595 [Dictyostelium purpureum]|eukprot:XP_003293696.1 hypothetical protein DICPUDRAFT_158595 [Dictyostelium purpureum]
MLIIFVLVLLLNNLNFSLSACPNSCGNPPYTLCKNNGTVIDGFGNKIDIDNINNRVVFTIKYSDEFEPRIVSIPIDGVQNNIKSQGTLFGQSTYQLIRGMFQFLPKSQNMVVNREVRIAGSTSNIFYKNNTFGNELTWNKPGNFIFDEDNNIQYTCWPYQSAIYRGSIGLYNNLGDQIYIGSCGEIKNNGNTLYIFDGSNTFYVGKLNEPKGLNPIKNLPVLYNDSKINSIKEFDVSTTDLFYSNTIDNKLYSVSLSNPFGPKKTILSIEPSSFKYYNGYIYYSYNSKIYRVSINGGTSQILYEGSTSNNYCICAQGFSGDSCNQCDSTNNLVSWIANGVPRCIPLNPETGNPLTCDYDYQCKSGKCQTIPISDGNRGC